MSLKNAVKEVLHQLQSVIDQIKSTDYTGKVEGLESSIGEHTRHIIEFYLCLIQGLDSGIINYDNRERNRKIETDPAFAMQKIQDIEAFINDFKNNPVLTLGISYNYSEPDLLNVNSNYHRELVYNIEHTIHHLAIIKPGIVKQFDYIELPENFGIASSTVRHKKTENA